MLVWYANFKASVAYPRAMQPPTPLLMPPPRHFLSFVASSLPLPPASYHESDLQGQASQPTGLAICSHGLMGAWHDSPTRVPILHLGFTGPGYKCSLSGTAQAPLASHSSTNEITASLIQIRTPTSFDRIRQICITVACIDKAQSPSSPCEGWFVVSC